MDKIGRKAGKGQKKVSIESKGAVGTGIAEAYDLNMDAKIDTIAQEIEGTRVKEMSPDTLVRMFLIVPELVSESLCGIV